MTDSETTLTGSDLKVLELARERAARGASLLDERVPGWHNHIDLSHLEMARAQRIGDNPEGCVLCQLDAHINKEPGDYYRFVYVILEDPQSSAVLGFDADEKVREFAFLDQAWTEEITRRRESAESDA